MADDATYKIVLEVQQREELDKLKKDFQAAHQSLVQLNSDLQKGIINQAQFAAQSKVVATGLGQMHTKIVALNTATRGGILGGSSGGMGYGLLQAGYAIDDLQYGLSAVVNNIPGLIMGFGGPAGLAGAIGIAAVAFSQLSKHWDEWFGTATDGPKKVVEIIDIAAERLKRLGQEFESMASGKSFEAKETGSLFKEYLSSGIAGEAQTGLAGALSASGTGAQMTEKEKAETSAAAIEKAVENAEKRASRTGEKFTDEDAEKVRKSALAGQSEAKETARARIYAANQEQAKGLLGAAPTETAARKQVMDLAGQFPDMFPKGFAEGMKGLEPEAVKAQEQEVQDAIDKGDAAKKAREDRQRAKKAQAAAYKELGKDQDEELKDWNKLRIDARRDQIESLEGQKKKIQEESSTKSQHFGDTASFVRSMQQGILNKIPEAQLKKLQDIDKTIKDLKGEITKIGTLR